MSGPSSRRSVGDKADSFADGLLRNVEHAPHHESVKNATGQTNVKQLRRNVSSLGQVRIEEAVAG